MFRTHSTLVSATWAGARLALDGGTNGDVATVIRNSSMDALVVSGLADIYVVRGATNGGGNITQWNADHVFGTGAASPRIRQSDLQSKLTAGLQPSTISKVSFVLVEVRFQYGGLMGSGILPVSVPMTAYAVIHKL